MATVNYDIDAQSDTAMSDANGYQEGFFDVLYVDDNDGSGGWHACSFRFHGVDLGGSPTINSATLTLARENDNSGSNGVLRCRAEASQTPATFSSGDRPYSRSHRSAYVEHTFPNDGTTQNVDVTSIVQDLVSVYSYNGGSDAMVFTFGGSNQWGIASVSWRSLGYALNHASGVVPRLTIDYSAGPAAYTLVCGSGSYAVTGNNLGLLRGLRITIAAGSYSITGNAVGLNRGYLLTCNSGSYSVSGSNINFLRALRLTANSGSYNVTGNVLNLFRGFRLSANSGSYAISGNNLNLFRGFRLAVSSGSYSITGNALAMRRSLIAQIASGSYSVTGNALNLLRGFRLAVSAGNYAVAGNNVALSKGGGLNNYTLACESGNYAVSGNSLSLLRGLRMPAGSGSYALNGNSVGMTRALRLTVTSGSYTVTGNALTLTHGVPYTAPNPPLGFEVNRTGSGVHLMSGESAVQVFSGLNGVEIVFSKLGVIIADGKNSVDING